MNFTAILLSIGGFFGGLISLKFLVINHYRINSSIGILLYNKIKEDTGFKFIMEEELVFDKKEPNIFKGLIRLSKIFILFDKSERLLTAGWESKEVVIDIYFFRWNTKKIKLLLSDVNKVENVINIYAMTPYNNINIGSMFCNSYSMVADKHLYEDIEIDVMRVLNGDINKTSALLHGKPGNGKTRFIRYIAQKYQLPIYTFYCNPDYTNLDILKAFSNIPSRCIVLFEDFDNYFEDRKCIMSSDSIKFTFDILLNCFDGVYNDYKEIIFFMTVNELDKVSDALKKRPSRFKYVREFTNPSVELKVELLGNKSMAEEIGDISLDQVFKIKDYQSCRENVTLWEAQDLVK
jgi:hypothetical protein